MNDMNLKNPEKWPNSSARQSLACLVDESSTMLIACSTCSGPSGIFRSLGEQICEPELQSVPFSLVKENLVVAKLSPMAKPVITGESNKHSRWTIRGLRERRVEKDMSGTWESPSGGFKTKRLRRTHKTGIGLMGKSESLIVVMKRVMTVERRGDTLGQRPTGQGVPLG